MKIDECPLDDLVHRVGPVVRDPRIRHEFGEYRVVAPRGQTRADGRFYLNGEIVLEKSSKDSLGNPCWTYVTSFDSTDKDPLDYGIYVILAAGAGDVK